MKHIKIGGHWYEIKEIDMWSVAHSQDYGSMDFESATIMLNGNSTITESRKNETLLHEILEAINAQHELELPHATLTTLSEVLFQVLVDNDGWWSKGGGGE
jgi:hypothetical protein